MCGSWMNRRESVENGELESPFKGISITQRHNTLMINAIRVAQSEPVKVWQLHHSRGVGSDTISRP